jgi:hypothetical protein
MDMYDLARWHPIKMETFCSRLSEVAYLQGEIGSPGVETLNDGRLRTVFRANVEDDESGVTQQPYLLMLSNPETGSIHTFVRTDATLSPSEN